MTEKPLIKAVVWDMGGVILRTEDKAPRIRLAERLGLTYEELDNLVFNGENADLATSGIITQRMYWDNLMRSLKLKQKEAPAFLKEFFGGDRQDDTLLGFIHSLRPRYQTGLLSNAWSDIRKNVSQYYSFLDAFDVTIFSAEVGLAKPDAPIFNLALEKLEVEAREAVFIDDLEANIEGACKAGLYGIQFRNTPQVIADLGNLMGIY